MYACTMCGLSKPELGSNPEFEFRSRRRTKDSYIEGTSDWCPKCEALRFFYKIIDSEARIKIIRGSSHSIVNYKRETRAKTRDNREMDVLRNWKTQHDLRREARKVLREEQRAELPSKVLLDSRGRGFRSHSEEHDRHNHRYPHASHYRSKSAINEPHRRNHRAEYRSHMARQCEQESSEEGGQCKKTIEEILGTPGSGNSRTSIKFKSKREIIKVQELELLNPFQEELLWRTNKHREDLAKREQKTDKDQSPTTMLDYERKPIFNAAVRPVKHLTVEDATSDMVEREELDDQLISKLKEKKHLVGEWEQIRQRVEEEYIRVKAELEELRAKRDKEIERKKNIATAQAALDRQRGGAYFGKYIEPGTELSLSTDKKEKTIGDALDEKLNHLLESLQESANAGQQIDKQEKEKPLKVEPTAPPAESQVDFALSEKLLRTEQFEKVQSEINEDCNLKELQDVFLPKPEDVHEFKPKRLLSKLHMLVSTVQRARFRGFPEDPQKLLHSLNTAELMKYRDPPPPQFSTLPCSPNELVNLLSIKREVLQPNMTRPLKVCRSPIFCPDSECRRMFFISDFNDHLTHEHPALPMERIAPCMAKTFFLDTRVTMLNQAKCNMVYFVKDKFFDSNSNKHPDLLPVLIMTARMQITEFFSLRDSETLTNNNACNTCCIPDQEIFMLWLTSVRPDDIKIVGTVSLWPTRSRPIIEYLMVHTNEAYNIRAAQSLKDIYGSNRAITVPGSIISRMTNNGENLLAVQVLIH
ncbi:uncharacterized protein LOC6582385 [Drosophila mojavensis]|uniref:DUF4729 domain-containing protein n=1 Tax=Drosophila mojavensis TaxID=7230 RepID=B4KWU3_DROMO|nr:uncharacterized protein LOC6582385 [Drosophila mojavensis]EDW18564.2 uncharacterized protein Dmoj_GI12019 [Drosophila mojavensis]